MAYYLKYEDKIIGPIAPDNPKWDWDDSRMMIKCKTFAKEMETDYDIQYDVIRQESASL